MATAVTLLVELLPTAGGEVAADLRYCHPDGHEITYGTVHVDHQFRQQTVRPGAQVAFGWQAGRAQLCWQCLRWATSRCSCYESSTAHTPLRGGGRG